MPAVGRKRHGIDRAIVLDAAQFVSAGDIPEADSSVLAAGESQRPSPETAIPLHAALMSPKSAHKTHGSTGRIRRFAAGRAAVTWRRPLRFDGFAGRQPVRRRSGSELRLGRNSCGSS